MFKNNQKKLMLGLLGLTAISFTPQWITANNTKEPTNIGIFKVWDFEISLSQNVGIYDINAPTLDHIKKVMNSNNRLYFLDSNNERVATLTKASTSFGKDNSGKDVSLEYKNNRLQLAKDNIEIPLKESMIDFYKKKLDDQIRKLSTSYATGKKEEDQAIFRRKKAHILLLTQQILNKINELNFPVDPYMYVDQKNRIVYLLQIKSEKFEPTRFFAIELPKGEWSDILK